MSKFDPVDPDVKIPAAVKALSAAADEIHANAYKKEQVPSDPEAPADPANPELPVEPAPSLPEGAQEVTSGVTPPPADEGSWEHKYKSMKGRFDASQTKLDQITRTLTEQISALQEQNRVLMANPPKAEASPATPARLLTPEDEENYGADFLGVVGRKAKEEILPEVSELKQQIAFLEQRLEGVGGAVKQTAKERMLSILDDRCSNWKVINHDNRFLQWLSLPDPFSGAIRQSLLTQAYEQNDAPRVLAFFNGFLAEEAATTPANEPDVKPSPTNEGKLPLEAFAAPGRAKTAAGSSPPVEKPIFTRVEIAKFYSDVSAGRFRGREAEQKALEMRIFEAQSEGRIR